MFRVIVRLSEVQDRWKEVGHEHVDADTARYAGAGDRAGRDGGQGLRALAGTAVLTVSYYPPAEHVN